ncbi:hypothetical protein HU200_029132 [Digitaria exilis]|uniref:Disease resistance protein At4g27190-like leucine-rich repeats domain-containing protein n=1 Tax=Digitaria exilis TaxID=1010633 RepID=A0A835BU82_9POAL|nr:hypothetical protein HU200_029132 [Digitaria exilis]
MQRTIAEKLELPALVMDMLDAEDEEDDYSGMGKGSRAEIPHVSEAIYKHIQKLVMNRSHLVDYELTTHGSNYWKCDGIMQLKQEDVGTEDDDGADRLWLYGDALYHELRLDVDYYQNPYLSSLDPVVRGLPKIAYWSSPTCGSILVPDPRFNPVRRGMFQQFEKLRVLKLSACSFSFTSPPFVCCHSLRFLWLDHCTHLGLWRTEDEEADEDIRKCFKRLWVLDVRYSPSFLSGKVMDFMTQLRELYVTGSDVTRQGIQMDTLQERLHNIRKLRITKCYAATRHRDRGVMFSGKDKMELLEFSDVHARNIERFSVESSCSSLETVIIGGSDKLKEISLKGCAKLKSLLLSGLFPQLYSLELSGTSVKTLDFSAVTAPELDELYLTDCEKLCAILWPPASEDRRKRYLGKLQIDTTQKEATETGSRSPAEFGWYICVRDARFLGSLEPIKDYFGHNDVHVDISTMASRTHHHGHADSSKDVRMEMVVNLPQVKDDTVYVDVAATLKDTGMQQQADDDSSDDLAILCQGPPAPSCLPLPSLLVRTYDSRWSQLEWCRVERCPKSEGVFAFGSSRGMDDFRKLKTMWVSHLLDARYILAYSVLSHNTGAFKNLTLLHIYCCPRLTHAVNLGIKTSFESLKALEIMWCGDVLEIFSFEAFSSNDDDGYGVWSFPSLKRINLQELPKLHGICLSEWKIHAPMLKTVRIRGCWSLRTLPIVSGKNMVVCDCEKEWWDKLQWDSKAQRSYYKPIHSRYYKKKMLRASPLRLCRLSHNSNGSL